MTSTLGSGGSLIPVYPSAGTVLVDIVYTLLERVPLAVDVIGLAVKFLKALYVMFERINLFLDRGGYK